MDFCKDYLELPAPDGASLRLSGTSRKVYFLPGPAAAAGNVDNVSITASLQNTRSASADTAGTQVSLPSKRQPPTFRVMKRRGSMACHHFLHGAYIVDLRAIKRSDVCAAQCFVK